GSLSVIGAVSPPGGDFSEPVTQNTLRVTKVFWALDAKLAYKRHFPAINWLQSYTLYADNLEGWYAKEIAEDFPENRRRTQKILQDESKLEEIVRLVGMDALSPKEQLTMETARMIREDFLFQNGFDPVDAYSSLHKQYRLLKSILTFMDTAESKVAEEDFDFKKLQSLPVKADIAQSSFCAEEDVDAVFNKIDDAIRTQISTL
ncbi:V-type ATP synthase subunit A, partial [Candidatus Peregrinibacteria bacterium CG10_big_fil_rev_8_21_14_0_10_42_8]